MRKSGIFALLLVCGNLVGSCADDSGTCPLLPHFGVQLHVQDAVSKVDLDRIAVVTIVRITDPVDSIAGAAGDVVSLTREQPGTYRIRVEAAGYDTYTQQVEVLKSSSACFSVDTQQIVVRLSKR